MHTVERMALIVLLTVTAGCSPDFVLFAAEDAGTSGELVDGTGPNGPMNGEPDGSNSSSGIDATDATSDRQLLRITAPDGSIITAGDPLDPDSEWMELVSVRLSSMQSTTSSDNPGPSTSSYSVVKYMDMFSVKLYELAEGGTRLPRVEISITRALMSSSVTVVLEGVRITSIQYQSHPDDTATEMLVLTSEKTSWILERH